MQDESSSSSFPENKNTSTLIEHLPEVTRIINNLGESVDDITNLASRVQCYKLLYSELHLRHLQSENEQDYTVAAMQHTFVDFDNERITDDTKDEERIRELNEENAVFNEETTDEEVPEDEQQAKCESYKATKSIT